MEYIEIEKLEIYQGAKFAAVTVANLLADGDLEQVTVLQDYNLQHQESNSLL